VQLSQLSAATCRTLQGVPVEILRTLFLTFKIYTMTRKLQQNAGALLLAADQFIFTIDSFTDSVRCSDALAKLREIVEKCKEPLHMDDGPVIPFPDGSHLEKELRFKVGDRVFCAINGNVYLIGQVTYVDQSDRLKPYRVTADDGGTYWVLAEYLFPESNKKQSI
jgi:hypothetical protein